MAIQTTFTRSGSALERLTDLDKERGAIGERYWSTQAAAARGKAVLLVEGEDDRSCLEAAMGEVAPVWSTKVRVIATGGRLRVMDGLEKMTLPCDVKLHQDPAQIFGLVDRDVWTDQEVHAQRSKLPNLHVTEGWCLENSLLLDEHGRVLPALQSVDMEAWVDGYTLAWAVQSTIEANPQMPAKLYERVSPHRLDWGKPEQIEPIVAPSLPVDPQRWADALSARSVVVTASARRLALDGLGPEELLLKGIHGKYLIKAGDVRSRLAEPTASTDTIRLSLAPNLRHRPFMQALIQALGLSSP